MSVIKVEIMSDKSRLVYDDDRTEVFEEGRPSVAARERLSRIIPNWRRDFSLHLLKKRYQTKLRTWS